MPRLTLAAVTAATLLLSLCGCKKTEQAAPTAPLDSGNAVYYWKNWMDLSENEKSFLADHNIGRMYVRLFDVVVDDNYGVSPNDGVYIHKDQLPENMEIVPTVFITLEALQDIRDREGQTAMKIYTRICDEMTAFGITNVPEIQIDCDWTAQTRDSFFKLCEELAKRAHKDNRKISSTIRLHQLSQPAPPVDSGVLMVYNVGDIKDMNETNSILRADIAEEYLSKAPRYKLPLDVAYPVFGWGVVFNGDWFSHLARIDGSIDSVPDLRHYHDNVYYISAMKPNNDMMDYGPQTLRYERADADLILEVKKMVEKYLCGKPHRTILYHLDENQLSQYTENEISSIYE